MNMRSLLSLISCLVSLHTCSPFLGALGSPGIVILIDDDGQESDRDEELGAVTTHLQQAISHQTAAILVSQGPFFNLLKRTYDSTERHPATNRDLLHHYKLFQDDWQLYRLERAGYFLLLPKTLLTASKENSTASGIHIFPLDIEATATDLTALLPMTTTSASPLAPDAYRRNLRYYLRQLLEAARDAEAGRAQFSTIDWKVLFAPTIAAKPLTKRTPWRIFIAGHGSRHYTAAGLPLETLATFLDFCNDYLPTEIVYITSCFLGGGNKDALQQKHYRFPLLLGSTGNYVSYITSNSVDFTHFFTAPLDQGGEADPRVGASNGRRRPPAVDTINLARFADPLICTNLSPTAAMHPAVANLVQAKSPGCKDFTHLYSPCLSATPLSPSSKPTHLRHSQAVVLGKDNLIIPQEISVSPLTAAELNLTAVDLHEKKMQHWAQFPTAAEMIGSVEGDSPASFSRKSEHFPAIQALFRILAGQAVGSPAAHRQFEAGICELESEEFLFPAFLSARNSPSQVEKRPYRRLPTESKNRRQLDWSLIDPDEEDVPLDGLLERSNSLEHVKLVAKQRPADLPSENHLLRKVVVEAPHLPDMAESVPTVGILQFIRDAFFDINGKDGRALFLIDELTGPNDFNLTFELARYTGQGAGVDTLEEALPETPGTVITLNHVYIYAAKNGASQNSCEIEVSFAYEDRVWQYKFHGDPSKQASDKLWNFVELTDRKRTQYYEVFTAHQDALDRQQKAMR